MCGHAAHLKCVEKHTLSLHHRAAGDQPYDGRFAANISEGEFLCPLCKQLSNILVPRDSSHNKCVVASSEDMTEQSDAAKDSLVRKLSCASKSDATMSDMERKALEDFGSNLYNAMTVPWERALGERAKKQAKWHPSIQKWDFEDSEATSSTSPVGSLLRKFRQQLISWAAVGHSASSLEAGARGVEEVLPFGTFSQTSDPWTEYSEETRDSHPLLLELKRSMASSAGLLRVLRVSLRESLGSTDNTCSRNIVGDCLANILDGSSWLECISEQDLSPAKQSELILWSELTALICALPCHLSRDGAIFQRCEARATAAAMWAVKGKGTEIEPTTDVSDPPAPFSIQQLFIEGTNSHHGIAPGWGTIDPQRDPKVIPFRPAVASGFLYLPLLSWDLHIFAGAAFSSLLSNEVADLPSAEELMHLAHRLLVARIVQCAVTPGGLELPDEMELDDDDTALFNENEREREGRALATLVIHCRAVVGLQSLKPPGHVLAMDGEDLAPTSTLVGVGRSILPFARSVVLLLRACTAVVRDRRSSAGLNQPVFASETTLNSVLTQHDIMTTDDGLFVAMALKCPIPSTLLQGSWFDMINRWVVGVVSLEIHHGSLGRTAFHAGISRPELSPSDQGDRVIGETLSTDNQILSDESTDGMDIDEGSQEPRVQVGRNDFAMNPETDDEEELADIILGQPDDMVSFDIVQGDPLGADSGENGESEDDGSDAVNNSLVVGNDGQNATTSRFANLSRSPILPFQPSLLGVIGVGLGRHKSSFDFRAASEVMSDLSHLGTVHRKETPSFTLVRLPKSFVELYNLVNKVKRRDASNAMDEDDDGSSSETAICLLTGTVMRSGSDRRAMLPRLMRPAGACTMHARKTASGVGVFFLVQKCTILLMHNNKSAYSPSIYVDEHGEEDPQLRRGRPLYLNDARYRALELLWRQQGIPREVAQIRSTSDRVIRDNWY
jgi:Proteolysis_6 C-terminal